MDETRLDIANARIRVLEGALARLPRTADGEVVRLGGTIYRLYDGALRNGSRYVAEETVASIDRWGGIWTDEGSSEAPGSELYSSREAAEMRVAAGSPITFKARKSKRARKD